MGLDGTPSLAGAHGLDPAELGEDVDGRESCPFCPFNLVASQSRFDSILASNQIANLVPALGTLLPGYLLVTAKSHLHSSAQMSPSNLNGMVKWTTELVHRLEVLYGPYLIFEHGSCAERNSGSCINHAHLHLIPATQQLVSKLLAALSWTELNHYYDLARFRDCGYVYLGVGGRHWVSAESNIPSQWIRRQVAEYVGQEDEWDWAINSGRENLESTLFHIARSGVLDGI